MKVVPTATMSSGAMAKFLHNIFFLFLLGGGGGG